MSRISGKDTKPELLIRKYLFSQGFRYRKNDKTLPGKPDIVLPKYCVAIFINGCFWHGHDKCKKATMPKSNTTFWIEKISKNKNRDKQNLIDLKKMGWRVITIWQCKLQTKKHLDDTLVKLKIKIQRLHK